MEITGPSGIDILGGKYSQFVVDFRLEMRRRSSHRNATIGLMMKKSQISRPILGWVMYDFANSAFATCIITSIFSVYFVKTLIPNGMMAVGPWMIPAESVWSYLVSAVMITVLLMAPPLGNYADHLGLKKRFLLIGTVFGSVSTLMLFGAKPGWVHYGVVFAFCSYLGFELSLVLYNAFLNQLAETDKRGWVSGLGFAWGYIGGGLCLALSIVLLSKPRWFGLAGLDPTLPARVSFLLVGVWWLVFSVPTFLWLEDKPKIDSKSKFAFSLSQVIQTGKKVAQRKDLLRFLLAYIIYNDGIQTLLIMAAIFGAKEIGMSIGELGLCILVIQFVAFGGALYFGRLADSFGHKRTILITLLIYAMVTSWAIFMTTSVEFWIMGVVVGIILGGSQAASRSLYAQLIPRGQEGEFFAIYAIVGKAAAVMGPLSFGLVTQIAGIRNGVSFLLFFFIIGGVVLTFVDER
ncbi:hypothetical protein BVX98_07575 [bacterium F11]|nr:hypothetical protein BVX98_07575 [bacterium F11]